MKAVGVPYSGTIGYVGDDTGAVFIANGYTQVDQTPVTTNFLLFIDEIEVTVDVDLPWNTVEISDGLFFGTATLPAAEAGLGYTQVPRLLSSDGALASPASDPQIGTTNDTSIYTLTTLGTIQHLGAGINVKVFDPPITVPLVSTVNNTQKAFVIWGPHMYNPLRVNIAFRAFKLDSV